MALQVSKKDTGRGQMLSLTRSETGQTQHVFIPSSFPAGSDVASAAAGVYVACEAFNQEVAKVTATLLPEVINEALKGAVPAILRGSFNAFRAAAMAYDRSNKKMVVDISTPTPATPTTQAIRNRAISMFDAAPTIADKARLAIQVFNLEQLSGLAEINAFEILPDDVAKVATDRYLQLRYAARVGLAARYPARATADNPIATGTDNDAVMSDAKTFVDAVHNHTKQVENAAQVCRDVTTLVALACQCGAAEAFALLAGNQA